MTQHTPTLQEAIRTRFHVSDCLPPALRRQGYRFEVVDMTHPSDGGPVAVSWHTTRREAEEAARAAIAKATQ